MRVDLRHEWRSVVSAGLFAVLVVLVLWLWHSLTAEERRPAAQPVSGVPDRVTPALSAATDEARANNIGVSYAANGRYEEALRCFRLTVSLNEDYLPGYKNLLAACVETEGWEEALEAALKAEELHPLALEIRRQTPPENEGKQKALRQERDFIANLAKAYLENGKLGKAERRYTLYLRLFPRDLRGFNGLAEVAFRQENYEKALRLFAQSLKLYGDQPEVLGRLTTVQEKAPELAGKVQWVLANYLEQKDKRLGLQVAELPPAAHPFELPIRDLEPVVELPKAPVPQVE